MCYDRYVRAAASVERVFQLLDDDFFHRNRPALRDADADTPAVALTPPRLRALGSPPPEPSSQSAYLLSTSLPISSSSRHHHEREHGRRRPREPLLSQSTVQHPSHHVGALSHPHSLLPERRRRSAVAPLPPEAKYEAPRAPDHRPVVHVSRASRAPTPTMGDEKRSGVHPHSDVRGGARPSKATTANATSYERNRERSDSVSSTDSYTTSTDSGATPARATAPTNAAVVPPSGGGVASTGTRSSPLLHHQEEPRSPSRIGMFTLCSCGHRSVHGSSVMARCVDLLPTALISSDYPIAQIPPPPLLRIPMRTDDGNIV